MSKNGNVVTVKNTKQKDGAEFGPLTLALKPVAVELPGREAMESCVLEPAKLASPSNAVTLSVKARAALSVLLSLKVAQTGAWRLETAQHLGEDIPSDTFEKWRKDLVRRGYVVAQPGTHPARYVVSESGSSAIGAPANVVGVNTASRTSSLYRWRGTTAFFAAAFSTTS